MTVKVALVTASSAGLGAAIARLLALDMKVVINYSSNAERAKALQEEILARVNRDLQTTTDAASNRAASIAARCEVIRADLGNRQDIENLVSQTVDRMGRLDVVVSNGGWTRIRKFDDLDQNLLEEDWDRCFNINVKSHLYLLQAARKHLEATRGVFVSVASVAGVKPSGSSIPYAVTKSAQIHLVKCLAKVVGPNIRVNSVSPGILLTDWGRQFSEQYLESAKSATVLKQFATVMDVAEAVKLLVLSQSITGQNIVIDSGFSL